MLNKLKRSLRPWVRGIQRRGQYPILLPGHRLTETGIHTPDGADRPLDAPLRSALALCDGSRTLAEVARQAGITRAQLIRAHEDGLLLFWRSPLPAELPRLTHAPHSIILSPHLDDAALSCGGRMLGDSRYWWSTCLTADAGGGFRTRSTTPHASRKSVTRKRR